VATKRESEIKQQKISQKRMRGLSAPRWRSRHFQRSLAPSVGLTQPILNRVVRRAIVPRLKGWIRRGVSRPLSAARINPQLRVHHPVATIGLDLTKNVFQVHGIDAQGTTVLRKRMRRGQVLAFFSRISRCVVGLEACATAHYWARELARLAMRCG
jgi:hypothetical protein